MRAFLFRCEGRDGDAGRRGPDGRPGTPGLKGRRGDDGVPGRKGEIGESAPVGRTGPKGDRGFPGNVLLAVIKFCNLQRYCYVNQKHNALVDETMLTSQG